jgi:voltage-gated potassium channel Kch
MDNGAPMTLLTIERHRGLLLLCTLAGMILFFPLLCSHALPLHVLESAVTLLLLAEFRLYRPPPILWWSVLGLGLTAAAVVWLSGDQTVTRLLTTQQLYRVPMLVLFSVTIAHRVFSAGPLNADRLLGAMCLYLLFGLIWANAYAVVHVVQPGAFRFTEEVPSDAASFFGSMIYFSYMTLTTVGFGDVAPHAPIARALATLESITGVLYVAVAISRMSGVLRLEEPHRGHHPIDPNP